MKRIIAVLLMVLLLLTGCGGLRGNSRSYRMEQEVKYLAGISQPLQTSTVSEAINMFTNELDHQNIFLTGIVPGVNGNEELEKYFFESINGMRKIDVLLVELPYSAGAMLNEYLKSGDEAMLNKVFEALDGTPYSTEENRSFYRQLKLYLDKKSQTIEVVGIDLEYMPELALEYISNIAEKHITDRFSRLKEIEVARSSEFLQPDYLEIAFKGLLKDIQSDEEGAQLTFGEDKDRLEKVLTSLVYVYEHDTLLGNEQFNHDRSDRMVENFLSVYDLNPEALYFGQLANPAVMQHTHLNYDWFASAIQKERETIKGHVVSLLYTYENCQRMVYVSGKAEKELLDLFKFDDKSVLDAIDQRYTLISLIEKDSIFNQKSIIFEKDFDNAVTDYFQYLVVLNGSSAAKPLK